MGKRHRRRRSGEGQNGWRHTEPRPGEQPAAHVQLSLALVDAVSALWSAGWQPADVVRAVRRVLGRTHERLAVVVIADDARSYLGHPRADHGWLAQLESIGAAAANGPGEPVVDRWAGCEGLAETDARRTATQLLSLLRALPALERVGAPPSEWSTATVARVSTGMDAKVLERVRALLAKAESTTFPAEAESLTAKAQQLMARHSIDNAVLSAGRRGGEEPVPRRVWVDDPYAAAKFVLLSEVAAAGRCQAVWSRGLGFSTVVGFENDLDGVDLLFTSLLVQATAALVAVGGSPRERTRSFRQSFLVGFAGRIGQRLRQAAAAVVDEAVADHGESLLPVLAGRDGAVDDALARVFPNLGTFSLGANDPAGRMAGVVAADRAELAVGPAVDRAS